MKIHHVTILPHGMKGRTLIHDTSALRPMSVGLFGELAVGGRWGPLPGNLSHISLDFDELPGGNATAIWYSTEFGKHQGACVSTFLLSGNDPAADGRVIANLYVAISNEFPGEGMKAVTTLVALSARPLMVSILLARSLLTARIAAEAADLEPLLAAAFLTDTPSQ